MNRIAVFALLVGLVTPASAQTSIRGEELSPTDAARVDRYCDVLKFRQQSSAASEPEAPPPGESADDSSSYWADSADAIDAALAKINLNTLTVRDCRDAGFYER